MSTAGRVRTANRLNALKVQKAKGPAALEDGNGLRLLIDEQGHKRWSSRVTIAGRRVTRGLGSYPAVSLDEARQKAEDLRRAARVGKDLSTESKAEQVRDALTFRQAFERYYIEVKRPMLTSKRRREDWKSSLGQYAMPRIGSRSVADVTTGEIIAIVQPMWHVKRDRASVVLQRMAAVFKSAIVRGDRLLANPCDGVADELGRTRPSIEHYASLPWGDVPNFVRSLEARQRMTEASRLALLFVILTACRSGEVRGARWSEINLAAAEWAIPAERMKMRRPHMVPLSSGAMAVLERASALRRSDTDLVFPSRVATPLSDATLSKLFRDAGIDGTPHGFRSSFKVWASENGVRDEVSEAVLAHGDPDRVRAAYRRTTFFDDRRIAMQRWSDYILGRSASTAS